MLKLSCRSKLCYTSALLIPLLLIGCGGGSSGTVDETVPSAPVEDLPQGTGQEGTAGLPPDPTGSDVPVANEGSGGGTDPTPDVPPVTEPDVPVEEPREPEENTGSAPSPGELEPDREPSTGSTALVTQLQVERFSAANYQQVISAVMKLSDLDDVVLMVRELRDLEATIRAGTSSLRPINIVEPPYDRLHICPDGGRLLAQLNLTTFSEQYVFDNCQIGGKLFTGQYSINSSDTDNFRETSVEKTYLFIGVAIEDALGSKRQLVGQLTRKDQSLPTVSTLFIGTPSLDITDQDGNGVRVARGTSDGRSPSGDTDLSTADTSGGKVRLVSMTVRSLPRISDSVVVRTVTAFAAEGESEDFVQGQLVISFDDDEREGNRIVLQAANGDPDTFDAFVFEQDDSVQSFTVNWSDRFRVGAPLRLPD